MLIYFVGKEGNPFQIPNVTLQLVFSDGPGGDHTVGGDAQPLEGIISTRRSNAAAWQDFIGKPCGGKWGITLGYMGNEGSQKQVNDALKKQLRDGDLQDILFVISYSGRTIGWPQ